MKTGFLGLIATAVVSVGIAAAAQAEEPGGYFKLEVGGAFPSVSDAFWEPPGFPRDPRVFFDLDKDEAIFGGLAFGNAWSNGIRGEVALSFFGDSDFAGPWSHTIPATPGPHASVSGSVRTTAVMANVYWEPFANGTGRLRPFVTAGVGFANNRVSDWTRTNAAAPRVTRTFEGASSTDLAWSLGLGATADIGEVNGTPVLFEAAYRYFDLGTAKGSATPLPGNGASMPVTPLQFAHREQVLSIGIRIPLTRN